uniref:Ycf1 n=1 Tax=Vincetoxicum lindleyi TaxID=228704 RepID=UPI0022FD6A24|nr:Ycf1 [Vincetoxicum lindleyi]WAN88811.1 Ycf1 [Vincetoxicum lindleyi]
MSSILDKLVFLGMKISNSVVGVGLYYGFMTIVSIGPAYFFLFRTQVMEERTETKEAARNGFFTGQFVVFISIFYTPLYLALGVSHTIISLAILYLFVSFLRKNFDRSITRTRNSLPNSSTQYAFSSTRDAFAFGQNLICQFFNFYVLPSGVLGRLVYTYLFRCNNKNKRLFLISCFVGWLIGQSFCLKILDLVLVWIRQNLLNFPFMNLPFIRSNKFRTRKLKFFVPKLIPLMAWSTSTILYVTCVYYLGILPAALFRCSFSSLRKRKVKKQGEEEQEEEEEEEVLFFRRICTKSMKSKEGRICTK